jgi:glycosyltransferase involved in cell wall biosynthesis
MTISVIICTHNPREGYLRRTLEALKRQSLPSDQWELLLIDNASEQPLAERWDLSWHPHARIVDEEKVGLTSARLRGIAESQAEILVFVDDDNLLAPDYLEQGLRLLDLNNHLGAIGAGRILPEYESSPHQSVDRYLGMLTLHDLDRDIWGNSDKWGHHVPAGAGMFVRRCVAIHYVAALKSSVLRAKLDRTGDSLSSSGDVDLALCACDLGMGCGVFKSLCLKHLISSKRLGRQYLLKLGEHRAHSCNTALVGSVPIAGRCEKLLFGGKARHKEGGRRDSFHDFIN